MTNMENNNSIDLAAENKELKNKIMVLEAALSDIAETLTYVQSNKIMVLEAALSDIAETLTYVQSK